jgi:type II secretory pathway pseudopilin PulG
MTFVVVPKARQQTGQLIMNGNLNRHRGFAYMALLVVIFSSLLVLTKAMPDIYQTAKREREAQLFFVGQQYQRAIEHFYENRFVAIKRYPRSFDELLVDNRSPKAQHFLRKLYRDPITQTNNWGLILNEQDQIMGIYSQSNGKVLKKHIKEQRVTISNVAGAEQYSDLKFVYLPSRRIN